MRIIKIEVIVYDIYLTIRKLDTDEAGGIDRI
jgi:hypothetical protein